MESASMKISISSSFLEAGAPKETEGKKRNKRQDRKKNLLTASTFSPFTFF